MIVHDVLQGSADWFRLRCGVPTASEFHQIITPTGKLSASSRKYAYRLISEKLLNQTTETVEGQQWMERGRELEPDAVRQYEFTQERETRAVGFITTDDGLLGASPDRLIVGQPAGLEVKCPAPHVHVGYLLDGPEMDKYKPQVMGQMLIGEMEWADLYSFHPRMPPALIRTYRDEDAEVYIKLLANALEQFNEKLFKMIERAKSLGVYQAFETIAPPVEVERGDDLGDIEPAGVVVERVLSGDRAAMSDWGF